MSQDDLGSRENQSPPSRRSRMAWVISLNIAAVVAGAAVFTGFSLGQHPPTVPSSENAGSAAGVPGDLAPTTAVSAGFSFTGASRYPCSDEGFIRSLRGGLEVPFSFTNNTLGFLRIIRFDGNGKRVTYDALAPGETYNVNTHIDRVWMIANSSASCLGIFRINHNGQINAFN